MPVNWYITFIAFRKSICYNLKNFSEIKKLNNLKQNEN